MRHAKIFVLLLIGLAMGCQNLSSQREMQQRSIALSEVAKKLDFLIYWDEVHNYVRLERDKDFVTFTPNQRTAQVNGQTLEMSFPAYSHEGEIYIAKDFYHQHLQPLRVQEASSPKTPSSRKVVQQTSATISLSSQPLVVLDPGHGGKDSGAVGIGGIQEKDLNLDICKRVAKYLRASNIQVVLTRSDDTFLTLNQRVAMGQHADCFVSVHFNSFTSPSAAGFEVWRYIGNESNKQRAEESLELAQKIHEQVVSHTPLKDRGVKNKGFRVIKATTVPAVLVECGFISSPQDMKWYEKEQNHEKMAYYIYKGIWSFLKVDNGG